MHVDIQLHTNKICPLLLIPTSLWSCDINVTVEPEEDTLVLTNATDGSKYKIVLQRLMILYKCQNIKFDNKPANMLTCQRNFQLPTIAIECSHHRYCALTFL